MHIYITERFGLTNADKKQLQEAGAILQDAPSEQTEVAIGSREVVAAKLPNLKFLQLMSAGFDYLDTDDLKRRGVILCNARGVYSIPIAEYVVGKILAVYKEDRTYLERQKKKEWLREAANLELYTKKVLMLGTGSIASEIAKRLKAFGCFVVGINTDGRDIEFFDECAPLAKLNDWLPQADIIINTLPANQATKKLLNRDNLSLSKKDALLINIGRGTTIVEADLIALLQQGHFLAVVLDVFEKEPLDPNSPLWDHPRVIITPHMSGDSDLVSERRKIQLLRNILHYLKGESLENRVF
ncbi:MAG: hypothetical protein LBR25_03295 [Erysipelotrichaceae bacterium]|nr:hypothetical protein [Erysipelotrichaceae bacterium]